jgi:hypothetical protein
MILYTSLQDFCLSTYLRMQNTCYVRFEVTAVVGITNSVFWDVIPRGLVQTFRSDLLSLSSALTIRTVGSSKTVAHSFHIIWRHIPDNCNLEFVTLL